MTEWRDIPGYEGMYQASSLGEIKSLARMGKTRPIRERILRASTPSRANKYPHVALMSSDGPERYWKVHQLVALAFLGQRFEGAEVCHRDGDPTNNAASNLRWGTRRENALDTVKHGAHAMANKTHCPHGHEYTPENTRVYPRGPGKFGHARRCATCQRTQSLARYYRYKSARTGGLA